MTGNGRIDRFEVFTDRTLDRIPQIRKLDEQTLRDMRAVAAVLPFRVNRYVVDELIDWDAVPDDPIYQLTFPQRDMLGDEERERVAALLESGAPREEVQRVVNEIRMGLNPHPAGQLQFNKPTLSDGTVLPGMQHKYHDTCLIFPSQGQTCHSYCSYCFRWAQFVGIEKLKFAQKEADGFHAYLREHPEIRDVLFTGGDPMVMRTNVLRRYIEPLLGPGYEHVQDIRIGTKAVAYWPQRFVSDPDADDLLRLFEEIRDAGKHVSIMAHYSHWRELETDIAREAVRRLRDAGCELRCQAPLIRHVNDDPAVWARLWETEVRLGMVPYYMFVERDTGAKRYFEVPLARAYEIFRDAFQRVTGLARTVRGPSMSATPGKVQVEGVAEIGGEKVFVLSFLRGRNPAWARRPFFARYDESATWLDGLRPAFGEEKFFFEDELAEMTKRRHPMVPAEPAAV